MDPKQPKWMTLMVGTLLTMNIILAGINLYAAARKRKKTCACQQKNT